jgi:hypothetical protein
MYGRRLIADICMKQCHVPPNLSSMALACAARLLILVVSVDIGIFNAETTFAEQFNSILIELTGHTNPSGISGVRPATLRSASLFYYSCQVTVYGEFRFLKGDTLNVILQYWITTKGRLMMIKRCGATIKLGTIELWQVVYQLQVTRGQAILPGSSIASNEPQTCMHNLVGAGKAFRSYETSPMSLITLRPHQGI